MRNLGSPADAALIDEVMVVAVDGREGAGTARVWRPAQSRESSCAGAHTESAEHLIGTTGDGRTFELNGGDQFADELIELCQRLNAGWLLVRRAAL